MKGIRRTVPALAHIWSQKIWDCAESNAPNYYMLIHLINVRSDMHGSDLDDWPGFNTAYNTFVTPTYDMKCVQFVTIPRENTTLIFTITIALCKKKCFWQFRGFLPRGTVGPFPTINAMKVVKTHFKARFFLNQS